MSIFDEAGHILTPEEILALSKTEEGRDRVKNYILRARTAFACQNMLNALDVVPSREKQMECCEILWETLFRVSIDLVMEWVNDLGEYREANPNEFEGYDRMPLC